MDAGGRGWPAITRRAAGPCLRSTAAHATARRRRRRTPQWHVAMGWPRLALRLTHDRLVRLLQRTVDDCEAFVELLLRDRQRRVREERVPAHERVEPMLAEERAERLHL